MSKYDDYEEELDKYYDKWLSEKSRSKRLEEGVMDMKQTIANLESDVSLLKSSNESLRDKCDRQAMILRCLTPEHFPDTFFITSIGGEKDQNGMPERLYVVPAYGVDFSYVYERTERTTGPEW